MWPTHLMVILTSRMRRGRSKVRARWGARSRLTSVLHEVARSPSVQRLALRVDIYFYLHNYSAIRAEAGTEGFSVFNIYSYLTVPSVQRLALSGFNIYSYQHNCSAIPAEAGTGGVTYTSI